MGVLKVYFKEYKWDALDQRVELPLPLPRRQEVMLINLLKLKLHLNNNLPETPMLEKLPLLKQPLQLVVMVMLVLVVMTVVPVVTVVTVTEAAELGSNFASANALQ